MPASLTQGMSSYESAFASSEFYVVDHTFKEGCNPEDWWKNITAMMADPEKLTAFHVV